MPRLGLGADLYAHIEAAATRYHVNKAIVARYAMQAGMHAALRRLQREVPPELRPAPEADHPEADV